MNRSADWLQQARADLELARVSAGAGHHEWACFACHQAVEKALKGLHLKVGQQAWGHGLGRSWRELPPPAAASLAAAVTDLEDRLRILDALYIPTRYPDSLPDGAPAAHFGRLQSADALHHARSIVDAIGAALA
ncbi:MAG: HEPN domain-containing protein [Cyanobacteriota bacterium]